MGSVPETSTSTSSPGAPFAGPHPGDAGAEAVPHPGVDASGRAIPISDEEWAARQVWLIRKLAEIDAGDDTPDEVYDQFRHNLDDERRRVGRPPAFGGTD